MHGVPSLTAEEKQRMENQHLKMLTATFNKDLIQKMHRANAPQESGIRQYELNHKSSRN